MLTENIYARSKGAKARVPYMFAGDLEFLQPILEMRETQASWEEQDVLEDQAEAQDQIGLQEGTEDLAQIQIASNLRATNPEEEFAVAEAILGPSNAPADIGRPAKVPWRRAPVSQPDISERLLEMLKTLSEKVDAFFMTGYYTGAQFCPSDQKCRT
ncbi:hypothetical protein AB205_0209010 [Aquarana catesbeiana]|uniref:Uncharacterized protein n=1 Tax=Aquarana catesbeiana TaxID=8400 RepID=A0A2G9SG93_AQUCT|nr:hypothetical protein AB205_0209010 [Aquarana catesbeiana]